MPDLEQDIEKAITHTTARALSHGTLREGDAEAFKSRQREALLCDAEIKTTLAELTELIEPTTASVSGAEDFADRWAALNDKLTRDEQDLLMTTLSGSEVNHALLYMVVAFVLGALAGWAGCALLS